MDQRLSEHACDGRGGKASRAYMLAPAAARGGALTHERAWPCDSQLRELEAACPGAKGLVAQRKACVGYFLAE